MDDYIDREFVLNEVEKLKRSPWYNEHLDFGCDIAKRDGFGAVVDLCIKQAPNVDVIPVVRCKDCINYETGKEYEPYCNHINGLDEAKPDDYCSLGEKKKWL